MRSILKSVVGFAAIFLIPACTRSQFHPLSHSVSQLTSSRDVPAKKTACVSFQGNGVYFSSHVGALIALLENNFEPVFATGGSSGAILAAVARALVENPSLSPDGEFIPQDAARVLAASAPVIESVLFLPRFTTPLLLIDSLDIFLTGSSVGVLRADPSDGLVNAESIVGQATLVIDFYRSMDFSEVLTNTSVADRESETARLWKSFANTVDVTPEQAADALLVDRKTLESEGRTDLVNIQDRIFKLYRSKKDSFHSNYKSQQDAWNDFIGSNARVFGLDSRQRRQTIFSALVEKVKTLESFDALAATLSGQFMLADPDRVYRAFEGFDSRTNQRIEIPSNTVIHTTARRAKKIDFDWKETQGIENLYQVYLTNPDQAPEVAEVLTAPKNNPLQPTDANLHPVIPSERIVVSKLTLGPALAATTGEPTAFLRYPIELDVPSRLRLGWTNVNETLIGYGGWLEKVSLGTARQFDQCAAQNVDAYFYTSDGDGVNRFAKMAFLGLFLDQPLRGLLAKQIEHPTDIRALLSGTGKNNGIDLGNLKNGFDAVVSSADNVFAGNRTVRGRMGNIPVDFNSASPASQKSADAVAINVAIRSNRRAMILAAYEFTQKKLAEKKLNRGSADLWNVPANQIKILSQTKPADILSQVNSVFPRLNY